MATDDRNITGIGVLADPVRRELYRYVCSQAEPVSRDRAAEVVGVARHQAKFHLDRLEAEGLLEADYVRLSGRTGPGAGRPAKRYRRSQREFTVTLPARDYQLAAQVMAEAITETGRTALPIADAVTKAADRYGALLAAGGSPDPPTPSDALDLAVTLLAERGYEPRRTGPKILLVNCPFHALARQHTELVCGMNHALITALSRSTAPELLDVQLDPDRDRCCVTLTLRHEEGPVRAS